MKRRNQKRKTVCETEFWRKAYKGFKLSNYPEINDDEVKFPAEIHIAYAVSVKCCGFNQFIVDGSTQICQYCGKTMFRTAVKKYVLSPDNDDEKNGTQT